MRNQSSRLRFCVRWIGARLRHLLLLAGSLLPLASIAAPANYEAGSVTFNQSNGNTWNSLVFGTTFATPPVVVMGPATENGGDAMVLRVRNVTTTGFEFQMDEWDYKDGSHTTETFAYLAISEGTHQFGAQTWQVGRLASVNRGVTNVVLSGFVAPPVVFAQVETENNVATNASQDGARALKTRLHNITDTGFEVRLETEEASNGVTLNAESIAYVAVTEGKGYLDGVSVQVGRTGRMIDDTWEAITFPEAATNPVLIAQCISRFGGDPCELRYRNLSSTGVEVYLEEEESGDIEVGHTTEDVGYIALGEMPGELEAKIEVGELAIVQPNSTTWTPVTFGQSYTTPVVVMGPTSILGGQPVNVRVRNVTSTGFECQLDEWDHADGGHATETVSYLVMESGSFAVGGQLWQGGRRGSVNSTALNTTFALPFDSAPVVLGQVATANDASAMVARVHTVTTANFKVQAQQSEIDASAQANEQVHYVAIQVGQSNFFTDGVRVEAGSEDGLTNGYKWQNFGRVHAAPYFFGCTQSLNDADPISLRYRYLFADKVEIRAQEDEHSGANNGHAAETLAWLVIQGAEDVDEDGAPDAWELAVGLDPGDNADGAMDVDGDLLTNQQEYHNGTAHDQFSGGTMSVAIPAVYANAYEKEGATGRYRLNRSGGLAEVTVNFVMSGTLASVTNKGSASPSDYVLQTTAGAGIGNSITVPANATSVDVVLNPVLDAINEYPEGAVLTLTASANYDLGGTKGGTVTISDATDTPENEKLFVGSFRPEGSSQTGANGVASLIINGSNTQARITTGFAGLTTEQLEEDGSHVHKSDGVRVFEGNEDAPGGGKTFPAGQLTDYPWTIVDNGGVKAASMIDELYQQGAGQFLYVNVHTDLYPGGEARAVFNRQEGSPVFVPPAAPPALENLADDGEVRRDVARFLTQATFGPTEAEIDALYNSISAPKTNGANRIAAFNTWINQQFNLPQSSLYEIHYAADQQEWALRAAENTSVSGYPQNAVDWHKLSNPFNGLGKESYDVDHNNRRRGWWTIAMQGKDQLRQRVAFALEQIFIISEADASIRTRAYGHSRYYDMLADHSDRGYRNLIEEVSKSPMMGKYLSHLQNQKTIFDDVNSNGVQDPGEETLVSPDENYAREIMQLFSIGLLERHPDGTLKLGANGLPIQTYTNEDIKELARVFTGWSFASRNLGASSDWAVDPSPNTNFFYGGGNEYFHNGYETPMTNFSQYHDEGAKVFLGGTNRAINNGEDPLVYAEGDLDRALGRIHNHPNTPPFIARLLIQRLVTSNPSSGYIHRVAQRFEDSNGNDAGGFRGSLKEVVRAILTDYEARSLSLVDPQSNGGATSVNVSHGKVKEPILQYIQVLRALGAKSEIPVGGLDSYGFAQAGSYQSGATMYRYGDTRTPLSQTPQAMPSVFNWYLPDYTPGGAVSQGGLVAPELQILTENPVVSAVNYIRQIEYSTVTTDPPPATLPAGQQVNNLIGDSTNALDNVVTDISGLVTFYNDRFAFHGNNAELAATDLVDRLDDLLCAGALQAKYPYNPGTAQNPRTMIIDQVKVIGNGNKVKAALYLITSSPEFIVQK